MQQQNPYATVIVAGNGPVLAKLAALCGRESVPALLAQLTVVAWAHKGEQEVPAVPLLAEAAAYLDCAAAFAAHPEADFACDLSADGAYMETFRKLAPPGMALLSSRAVSGYCDAALAGELPENPAEILRKSRWLFDALIDEFEEEIVITDDAGRIVNLNAQVLDLWGGTRSDYVGRECSTLYKPELFNPEGRLFFGLALESGCKVTETFTEVTPDGRMLYFHINAFPLRDEDGEVRRLVLTRRNTTDQVRIEQRLYQSQKMAAIGELSTYIAHEIRNPLFSIGGFANSLIRMAALDETAREKARIILEESQRLDDILKSIINFARPTEQALGDVEVNLVAAQTVEIMGLGTEKNITIVQELARDIPKVHGNAEMLKQCLINLIKNAQEAMSSGTIHVRTHRVDSFVHLEVEDNGPGIHPEFQEKIFSPFFSTKDKGAGLGLAMTRKIMNEIGGKLILKSTLGQGTTVTLVLKPVLGVAGARKNMNNTIVIASRNKGKIRELEVLLKPFGVSVKGLDDFPEIGDIAETGSTFAENALIKAATVSARTGLVAVADDSGLVVDALDGGPGVYSARYSEEPNAPATDERNTAKVLAKTAAVPDSLRTARFVSVMAAAAPDNNHILAEGVWEGALGREPQGQNGFGYDPIFIDPELGLTAAAMSPEEKNARSHRAKACAKLLTLWPGFWEARPR